MLKDIYFHRKEGQGDPKVCPFFRKRPFNCTWLLTSNYVLGTFWNCPKRDSLMFKQGLSHFRLATIGCHGLFEEGFPKVK